MSGSGGGDRSTPEPEVVACERLQFETVVRSPNPAIVAQIKIGDVLDVGLDQSQVQALVLIFAGQVVGGIVSPQARRLRECIREGTIYKATVVTKPASNIVTVRITPSAI